MSYRIIPKRTISPSELIESRRQEIESLANMIREAEKEMKYIDEQLKKYPSERDSLYQGMSYRDIKLRRRYLNIVTYAKKKRLSIRYFNGNEEKANHYIENS